MDYEPKLEESEEETNEKKQIEEVKEWLKASYFINKIYLLLFLPQHSLLYLYYQF